MTPVEMAHIHAAAMPDTRAWTPLEFKDLIASPGGFAVFSGPAFALGRIAADEAELLLIACDPAFQRKGYGKSALSSFENAAADRHATRIFLDVAADNSPALSLYVDHGYYEIGRRPDYYARQGSPAIDAYVMAKALNGAS